MRLLGQEKNGALPPNPWAGCETALWGRRPLKAVYMKRPEQAKPQRRKGRQWLPGAGGGGGGRDQGWWLRGTGPLWGGVIKMF